MKTKAILIALTISLLCLFVWNIYGQKPRRQVGVASGRGMWEYKVVQLDSEVKFNDLGAQGWELVGFEGVEQGSATRNCVFKRAR